MRVSLILTRVRVSLTLMRVNVRLTLTRVRVRLTLTRVRVRLTLTRVRVRLNLTRVRVRLNLMGVRARLTLALCLRQRSASSGLISSLFTSCQGGAAAFVSDGENGSFCGICAADANVQPPPRRRGCTAALITVSFCCRHPASASVSLSTAGFKPATLQAESLTP